MTPRKGWPADRPRTIIAARMDDDIIAAIDHLEAELSRSAGKRVGRSEIVRALIAESIANAAVRAAASARILTAPRYVSAAQSETRTRKNPQTTGVRPKRPRGGV